MLPESLIPAALAGFLLAGCVSQDPVRTLAVQPDGGPKFDVHYEPDLGMSDGVLRFEIDPSRWGEPLFVGGRLVGGDEIVTVTVVAPFSAGKGAFIPDPAGIPVAIDFVSYTTEPDPFYEGPALVPEYSPVDLGTWLHVLVGSRAEHGVKVLVRAP